MWCAFRGHISNWIFSAYAIFTQAHIQRARRVFSRNENNNNWHCIRRTITQTEAVRSMCSWTYFDIERCLGCISFRRCLKLKIFIFTWWTHEKLCLFWVWFDLFFFFLVWIRQLVNPKDRFGNRRIQTCWYEKVKMHISEGAIRLKIKSNDNYIFRDRCYFRNDFAKHFAVILFERFTWLWLDNTISRSKRNKNNSNWHCMALYGHERIFFSSKEK